MPLNLQITIEPRTLKAATAKLDPAIYHQRTQRAMNESLAYLKGLVQENTPVNLGLLRAGIFTELRGTPVDLHGIVAPSPASKDYAEVMELGRKPGGRMPPVDAILKWVHSKGSAGTYSVKTHRRLGSKVTQASQDRAAAWLIARSIGIKGTKPHHMFQLAWQRGQATVQRIFAQRIAG